MLRTLGAHNYPRRMAGPRSNKVSVVEAAYLPATSDTAWLAEIVNAALPLISEGLGAMACVYSGARGTPVRGGEYATADLAFPAKVILDTVDVVEPELADRAWRLLGFGLCSEVTHMSTEPSLRLLADAGVGDILSINAYDPSGIGVWLGAPLRAERKRRPNEASAWTRVAAHIGSALRLRRDGTHSSSPDDAIAVLDTRGRITHARNGKAADRLRGKLQEAVVRMDRARGQMRRRDPDGAVEIWRTLVDGELTLLDHFERGGQRYVVAVANPPRSSTPGLESLAPRERHVVAAAAAGHSNKLIAYELGIAASTVRVLLSRAAQRLGATSRRELVAIVRARGRTRLERPDE